MGELIQFPSKQSDIEDNSDASELAEVIQLGSVADATDNVVSFYKITHNMDTDTHFGIDDKLTELANSYAEDIPLVANTLDLLKTDVHKLDLGVMFTNGVQAVNYLQEKHSLAFRDALDYVADDSELSSYDDIKKFWAKAHMQAVGEKVLDDLVEDSGDDKVTCRLHSAALTNLREYPASFLNCLAAGVVAGGWEGYSGTLPSTANELESFIPVDISREVLEVLSSDNIGKRPYASWYLISKISETSGDISYVRALTGSLKPSHIGVLESDNTTPAIVLADRINYAVKSVVRRDWDEFSKKPHDMLIRITDDDVVIPIDGALDYSQTKLNESYVYPSGRGFTSSMRRMRDLKRNLSAMTEQIVKYQ